VSQYSPQGHSSRSPVPRRSRRAPAPSGRAPGGSRDPPHPPTLPALRHRPRPRRLLGRAAGHHHLRRPRSLRDRVGVPGRQAGPRSLHRGVPRRRLPGTRVSGSVGARRRRGAPLHLRARPERLRRHPAGRGRRRHPPQPERGVRGAGRGGDGRAATQSNATWGLDRVDQRALPLDSGSYTYDNTGAGVRAYIIDTGILLHSTATSARARPSASTRSAAAATTATATAPTSPARWAGTTWGVAKASP
jgi:hypothetical protein